MKIYFAGSIRGGRDDRTLYLELIEYLREFGEVLTEHVGDPALEEFGEKDLSDNDIFRKDMDWLTECDAVVAEVTVPSLGVGYEIGRAVAMGKPVLCLYRPRPGKRISAMIAGDPSLRVREYVDPGAARGYISDFVEFIAGIAGPRRSDPASSSNGANLRK